MRRIYLILVVLCCSRYLGANQGRLLAESRATVVLERVQKIVNDRAASGHELETVARDVLAKIPCGQLISGDEFISGPTDARPAAHAFGFVKTSNLSAGLVFEERSFTWSDVDKIPDDGPNDPLRLFAAHNVEFFEPPRSRSPAKIYTIVSPQLPLQKTITAGFIESVTGGVAMQTVSYLPHEGTAMGGKSVFVQIFEAPALDATQQRTTHDIIVAHAESVGISDDDANGSLGNFLKDDTLLPRVPLNAYVVELFPDGTAALAHNQGYWVSPFGEIPLASYLMAAPGDLWMARFVEDSVVRVMDLNDVLWTAQLGLLSKFNPWKIKTGVRLADKTPDEASYQRYLETIQSYQPRQ